MQSSSDSDSNLSDDEVNFDVQIIDPKVEENQVKLQEQLTIVT